jgi:hypothetical protein
LQGVALKFILVHSELPMIAVDKSCRFGRSSLVHAGVCVLAIPISVVLDVQALKLFLLILDSLLDFHIERNVDRDLALAVLETHFLLLRRDLSAVRQIEHNVNFSLEPSLGTHALVD